MLAGDGSLPPGCQGIQSRSGREGFFGLCLAGCGCYYAAPRHNRLYTFATLSLAGVVVWLPSPSSKQLLEPLKYVGCGLFNATPTDLRNKQGSYTHNISHNLSTQKLWEDTLGRSCIKRPFRELVVTVLAKTHGNSCAPSCKKYSTQEISWLVSNKNLSGTGIVSQPQQRTRNCSDFW